MKKQLHPTYVIAAIALLSASALFAGNSGSNNCSITIPTCNELAITGTATITVATPTAGAVVGYESGNGTNDGGSSVKLKLTTNDTARKVQAKVNTALPTGSSLKVEVLTNGSGLGTPAITALSATDQDLINGIDHVATDVNDPSGIALKFTLKIDNSADGAALSTSSLTTRTVTFTMVADS